MLTKICTKCGISKKADSDNFHKRKDSKDGLTPACKVCTFKRVQKYQGQNREKIKQYNKKYREQNREEIKQYNKKYREQNKNVIKSKVKAGRANDPLRYRSYSNTYYKRNRNERKEIGKQNRAKYTELLPDHYVRTMLIKGNSVLRRKDIPNSAIHAYRIHLKLKRLIKQKTT